MGVKFRRVGAVALWVAVPLAGALFAADPAHAAPPDQPTPVVSLDPVIPSDPADPSEPPGPTHPNPQQTPNDPDKFEQCQRAVGPVNNWCYIMDRGADQGGGFFPAAMNPFNPLETVADGCATAAAWIIRKLAEAVDATTQVDFTNPNFIKQYSVVFAASTILTMILWLLAVTKRAVRGAPITEAFGEAIGYLWLTVIASAFTPLVLALMVQVTDAVTYAIASGTKQDTHNFLQAFASTIEEGDIGGGPIMLIFVALLAVLAAAIIWVELLVRAAMLYVGAVLGTAVYSGLVDRNLWHHVRRWAGIMIAIDLCKPIIIIVLSLATAVTTSSDGDPFSTVLTGLAIMFLSIFASAAIYRFVPVFGDDMAALYASRRSATSTAPAIITGPATFMREGIAAHGNRTPRAEAAAASAASLPATAGVMAAGVAAHTVRNAAGAAYRAATRQDPPAPPPPPPPPAPPSDTPGRDAAGG
ncbi:hypothetical protein [Carbonactinospora thermoautotrophica]|uniref:hypothetical protein n=2 Tax=Carbonactinospora thermoautotrophica TaxID=1469144 RepID=UPI000B2C8F00|nr:hypothetical protein [Carbonactinospora thermoautotrophica]